MSGAPAVVYLCGRDLTPCGYCRNADTPGEGDSPHRQSQRAQFDIYSDNVSGWLHQHFISHGFRRCGSLFYRPEWDSCCRLVPIRCFSQRKPSRGETKVLKRLLRYLSSGHQAKEDDGAHKNTKTIDPVVKVAPSNVRQEMANEEHAEIESLRQSLDKATERYLQLCLGDADQAKKASRDWLDRCRSKLLAPSLKPSLDSSLCRLASNVAIGIHGIAKKYGVDLGSPVHVANEIAAQWMQQHGSETSLVFVRDNGYLEIDVAIDPSYNSAEQKKRVGTCGKFDKVVNGTPAYYIRLTLSPASFEPDEYQLYEKYQAQIHRDHRSTPDGYRRFLCDSGLAPSAQGSQDPMVWRLAVQNGETPRLSLALSTDISEFSHSEPFLGCGTFHFRYELCHCDDASPRPAQLIAMSVLDVLPDGLSSVYFIYDTDYAHLSLGTLSATIELSIIEMWRQQCCTRVVFPSEHQSGDVMDGAFGYYYLGFYIHTCPKMVYKGRFSPSFLLCPDTNKWVPFEEGVQKILASTKRLASDTDTPPKISSEPIPTFLIENRQMTPQQLLAWGYKPSDKWLEMFRQFALLIGADAMNRLVFALGRSDVSRVQHE